MSFYGLVYCTRGAQCGDPQLSIVQASPIAASPLFLCVRFLSWSTSGRLMLLAWLPVCIVGKGNEYHLYWLHPLKHSCTMYIRIVNPCSNFTFLTCRLLLVGLLVNEEGLPACSLSTFSISLYIENIAHKPSLACLLRSSNREPSSSVCPYLLSRFCSHQIY